MKNCTKKNNKAVKNNYEYFCGIDIHKKKSYVYIVDNNGNRVLSKNISTTKTEYTKLFSQFDSSAIQVAIEIGSITFTYCDLFNNLGIDYHIVNTTTHLAIATSTKKTDKNDAKRLAINLWKEVLPEQVYMPTKEERELRILITHRSRYVKQQTRLINKTMAFLSNYDIVLKRKQLKSHETWEKLEKQIMEGDNNVLKLLFKKAFKEMYFLWETITELEELLLSLVKNNKEFYEKYQLLTSIPGVAFVTAITIIGIVGDISRFDNVRQFASYLGLCPKVRDSGGKQYGSRKITKRGNGLLRGYLCQGVISMLNSKKPEAIPLQTIYDGLKKRRGWKKARVAMSRKYSHIIFGILKYGKPYNPAMVIKTA